LLVSNHQSFFDPVLVTMALPREGNYMARHSLFANPVFERLITSLNAFPIRRNSADIQAVKETMRRLKSGKLVVTFPEGTRTRNGSVGRFLPGAGAVALKARAAVVPVFVDGAYRSWPRHRTLPRPVRVSVRYGTPLTPEQLADYTPVELADLLRRRVIALQHGKARSNEC
jgi:1-acyl-sn-glycerol-3-phosphate acyltransferase